MKIGLLTLHYGFNEGAILQALCLSRMLAASIEDSEVEIIDHRYPDKVQSYTQHMTRKSEALRDSIETWLPLGPQKFYSNDHEATQRAMAERYDCIVVGSDIVWNLPYKRRLRGLVKVARKGFHPPFPNVYWPYDSRLPWYSYAASAGDIRIEDIPWIDKVRLRRCIRRMRLISVRDQRTAQLIGGLAPELVAKVPVVPDPTIMWDLRSQYPIEEMRRKFKLWGIDLDRPRCAIVGEGHPLYPALAQEMRDRQFQIIGFKDDNDFCDVNLAKVGMSPLEWACALGMVDLCITERMHASIFCIVNRTPFVSLDINMGTAENPSKLEDLLSRVGMSDFYMRRKDATVGQVLTKIDQIVAKGVDWDFIGKKLAGYRLTGENYIAQMKESMLLNRPAHRH